MRVSRRAWRETLLFDLRVDVVRAGGGREKEREEKEGRGEKWYRIRVDVRVWRDPYVATPKAVNIPGRYMPID